MLEIITIQLDFKESVPMELTNEEKKLIKLYRIARDEKLREILTADEFNLLKLYKASDRVEFTKHSETKDEAAEITNLVNDIPEVNETDKGVQWLTVNEGKIKVTAFYREKATHGNE